MRFGVLRVLNDDVVAGGKGFGSHPHDNMEIISIPLEGSLVHEDNMGHEQVVTAGEIQVMSTGKGVFHSEYNNSPDQPAKFLQIWIFPNRLNVEPRYGQMRLDAWFHLGRFDDAAAFAYERRRKGNGIYLFVIKGAFLVDGRRLEARDGLGVTDLETITLRSEGNDSEILIMDVPMNNKI